MSTPPPPGSYAKLLAGEAVEASYDPEAEVAGALRRLQAADVVLTSFDVLRAEVYFVPSSRSLRHAKRYAVPHCPLLQARPPPRGLARSAAGAGRMPGTQLLRPCASSPAPPPPRRPPQVHWWRLVIDEAQMVGPLSAAGTMCERMHAVHRWCVTGAAGRAWVPTRPLPGGCGRALPHAARCLPEVGRGEPLPSRAPAGTPMGAHRDEGADLHALLHTLQHQPFGGAGLGGTRAQRMLPPPAEGPRRGDGDRRRCAGFTARLPRLASPPLHHRRGCLAAHGG